MEDYKPRMTDCFLTLVSSVHLPQPATLFYIISRLAITGVRTDAESSSHYILFFVADAVPIVTNMDAALSGADSETAVDVLFVLQSLYSMTAASLLLTLPPPPLLLPPPQQP